MKVRIGVFAILFAAALGVGCSSGGQNSALPGGSAARSVKHTIRAQSTVPPNTWLVTGPVNSFTQTVINVTANSCGKDDFTHANTVYDGPTPAAGNYVAITATTSGGTYPCPTPGAAVYVSTYTAPVPTASASGTITTVSSDGYTFGLTNGSTTSTIVLNSQDDGSANPIVGASANVSGYGTIGRFIHATSVTITTPTPPAAHIRTFAYVYPSPAPPGVAGAGYYGSAPQAAAPYLSWALTDAAGSGAYQGSYRSTNPVVKLMEYVSASHATYATNASPAPDLWESWLTSHPAPTSAPADVYYEHGASGCTAPAQSNRVVMTYGVTSQYVVNVGSSYTQSTYEGYVQHYAIQGKVVDAEFEDDVAPLEDWEPWSDYNPEPPCGYSDSAWFADEISLENALYSSLGVSTIYNGVEAGASSSPTLTGVDFTDDLFSSNSGVIGGRSEDCYDQSSGSLALMPTNWAIQEDGELKMATVKNKNGAAPFFICMESNTADAASSVSHRIYVIASLLLTYDTTNTPSTTSLWELYTNSSKNGVLTVYPESQLVVANPTTTPPPNGVQNAGGTTFQPTAGGAFVRQYNACFYAGTFVGPCGVAVNPYSSSVANPLASQYGHTFEITGTQEGVLDGGTADVSGPAASGTLSAGSGVIMFN